MATASDMKQSNMGNHVNYSDLLYLHHARTGTTAVVNARGIWEYGGGIRVFAGSRAALKPQRGLLEHQPGYDTLRNELISKRVMEEHAGCYVFTKDYVFRSPSAASCVIRADSSDGRREWRRCSDGKSILDFSG